MESLAKAKDYDNNQIQLIKDMYAKNTTKEEFELFMYTAAKYQLDPLVKQIWCVQFEKKENGKVVGYEKPQIYAGRDGFLEIAHRSGAFNGMKSGMKNATTAYAEVYRKDMQFPFYVEVDLSEYSTGKSLWGSKPHTMLVKVAESQALRKAFSISGIYSPEEMSQWELETQGITFNTVQPTAITTNNAETKYPPNREYFETYDWSKVDLQTVPEVLEWGKNPKTGKSMVVKNAEIVTKLYFLALDLMPKEEVSKFYEEVTGKKYGFTYEHIKIIAKALMSMEDDKNKSKGGSKEELREAFEQAEFINEEIIV